MQGVLVVERMSMQMCPTTSLVSQYLSKQWDAYFGQSIQVAQLEVHITDQGT